MKDNKLAEWRKNILPKIICIKKIYCFILDPKFNLHLKMPSIKQAYIVRKPTEDGIVSSLELFDETGDLIVYFFGARKPGIPELEEWKTILLEVQPNATSIA